MFSFIYNRKNILKKVLNDIVSMWKFIEFVRFKCDPIFADNDHNQISQTIYAIRYLIIHISNRST